MNILDFLKRKLTSKPQSLSPAEVQQVKTDKVSLDLLKKFGVVQSDLHKMLADATMINWERAGIYGAVNKCFTGDTKVALLDGRDVEIKQLAEEFDQGKVNYVYSVDVAGKKIVRSPISWAGKTGTLPIMKVTLDNNEEIKCTLNHKFMLRDGTYKEAQHLSSGESLMPLYRRINEKKPAGRYWHLYEPFLNRDVIQYVYFNKSKPKGHVTHHCFTHYDDYNLNKLDDTPENHQNMSKKEHQAWHAVNRRRESWVLTLKTNNYKEYVKWCKQIGVIRKQKQIPAWNEGLTKETSKGVAKGARTITGRRRNPEDVEKYLVSLIQNSKGVTREEAKARYDLIRTGISCPECGVSMHPDRKFCSNECRGKAKRGLPTWNAGLKNHKVKSIEILNQTADVYDLTIEPNHNFALSAGVFVHNSLAHPLMCAAAGLYADYASTPSQLFNSTVWVTTENREYKYQIEKLFDIINLEEVVYDWLWTMACFGDLFVEIHGEPGIGVVSISDDVHPVDMSRVDWQGRLVGFYSTPMGYAATDERQLLPPWQYVHGRLLGAKKRRSQNMDQNYTEFRTISIMTPDDRRLTSKYGTSILLDALPTWKRLRLAEDSLMMARLNRGVLRYIYSIAVGQNQNPESVASLIDSYIDELKRARALDTTQGASNYQDRFNAMSSMEDIIIPVWGDTNNIKIDKIGGEVDIKWIVDIEELRNQLATALRVPLALLSGYTKEGSPGGLGQASIERMDIRFARQARRLQRSLINMLTRMVQIHLAYQGMDPDLNLFKIQMTETSSAEEEELKSALDKGVDVVDKLSELVIKCLGEVDVDKKALLDYLNKKFLKLNDMDIEKLLLKANPNAFKEHDRTKPVPGLEDGEGSDQEKAKEQMKEPNPFRESSTLSDFKAATPINESSWKSNWEGKTVKVQSLNEAK